MACRMGLALALLICWSSARADIWFGPTPRVFASADGRHGFKVLVRSPNPLSEPARGMLFNLDADGNEKVIWERDLVNVPHRVLLPGSGKAVVTVDTYARLGYAHSLVVYGSDGRVLADYALEDLLTAEEIRQNVRHSVSSRWWASDADFAFTPDGRFLVVRLRWGKAIRVRLDTGAIVPPGEEGVAG